ncbi:NAD-dependent epimerase/dehydratase family protein [Marinicrinis sediminis]|uniref:NAD-dependent epimerase/dehydratase family protein n=1 Tax=Marinicrinis sediminis TaxID=1652465 RepID=A0ABW5R6P2_9BACL
MNVLITGGYGFIGSFVAERFFKEGYKIYIIDNLSTGHKENVTIPHHFYELDITDSKCEEVFRSVQFDVVVHLAAQTNVHTSIEHPYQDTHANISGLVHMLELSSKHHVRRFMLASSAAVYGNSSQLPLQEDHLCDPLSPYGMNKLLGEYYTQKWKQIYQLSSLCFRFSNVYGPRQTSSAEGGVISIFMDRLQRNEEIQVYGDGEQTRDFIYVEDVADAIFKGAKSTAEGVLNLSTNSETSINELLEKLSQFKTIHQTSYLDPKPGDIYQSRLDNRQIVKTLDWVPLYDLDKGLKKTFEWQRGTKAAGKKKTQAKKKEPIHKKIKWLPYIENLVIFILLCWFTMANHHWVQHTFIDYKIIYIIFISVLYGTRQSLISVLLSIGLYFYERLDSGRELVSLLYDTDALFNIAIYLFFGLLIGYSTDKRRADVEYAREQLENEKERYHFLNRVYRDTQVVKEELQSQIIHNEESLGTIYSIIKELELLEPQQVLQSSVEVLEKITKSSQVSVYSINEDQYYLRLMAKSQALASNHPRSIKVENEPYLKKAIEQRIIWMNKTLDPDLPMYIIPIVYENRVTSVIFVHQVAFQHFSLYRENALIVTSKLIATSLSRAIQFETTNANEKYMPGTKIILEPYFTSMLANMQEGKRKQLVTFTLLRIIRTSLSEQAVGQLLHKMLRDTDAFGYYHGAICILLHNTNPDEADIVIQRLEHSRIFVEMMSEDRLYA